MPTVTPPRTDPAARTETKKGKKRDGRIPLPPGRLSALRRRVYGDRQLCHTLQLISSAASLLCAAAAAYAIGYAFAVSVLHALKPVLVAAVPFLLVTLVRRLLDLPRPYEVYDLYDRPTHDRQGRGFPSRHAASAAVIAVILLFECLPLGLAVSLVGLVMCVCRVLLGIHFVRDVLAGALIGAVGGVLGMLFLPL